MAKVKNIAWQEYEDLIFRIYKELEPLGKVTKNDSVWGHNSQSNREIDISLRTKVASHEILIVVEAKNTKRPVTQQVVDAFSSVIKDVKASKGIIICNAGFTKTVKENANRYGIDLMTAHDASKIDWQTEIQIPVLKQNVKITVTIQQHFLALGPMTINGIQMSIPLYAYQEFIKQWEADTIPKVPGIHYMPLDASKIPVDTNKWSFKMDLKYEVVHRYHFKYFIPNEYRGLKDYLTQKFTPSFMSFSEKIPFLNDGSWKYVEEPKSIAADSIRLNIEVLDIDFLDDKKIRYHWEKER